MTIASVPFLTLWQRRIVAIAWITYAAYYLGRVNLATAMPRMQADLDFSAGQVGLLSTGFFWAYAVGQLVNGRLGDRLSPRRFVLAGIVGTAIINLVFSRLSAWPLLILLWTMNGYFQATGWGPILRLLANWLTPVQRTQVSGVFGSCFVAGNAFTWLLTGWIIVRFGWRASFWLPALLLLVVGLLWFELVRDTPAAEQAPLHPTAIGAAQQSSEFTDARRPIVVVLRRFWPIMAAAAFVGVCFVSLIVWMPTYYVEVGRLDIGPASTVSALLPLAGIGGTLVIGWLVGRYLVDRELPALAAVLLAAAVLFFVFPMVPTQLVLLTAVLMLAGSIVYAASSLTLTTMPLALSSHRTASSMAGILGFAFNMGAGLGGGIVGAILDAQSWSAVFVGLGIAALAGAFCVLMASYTSGVK